MAGLRALAQLELDHPDLLALRDVAEAFGIETTGLVAAAEIAAAKLPHDVAAMGSVIGAETAFAGVVIETTALRAEVERLDRPRAERAEAHRGNVEQRRGIGRSEEHTSELQP